MRTPPHDAPSTSEERGVSDEKIWGVYTDVAALDADEGVTRADFAELRRWFIDSVGAPVDPDNPHRRRGDAKAFGRFAAEADVLLAERTEDTDARMTGELIGVPMAVDGPSLWFPVLVCISATPDMANQFLDSVRDDHIKVTERIGAGEFIADGNHEIGERNPDTATE